MAPAQFQRRLQLDIFGAARAPLPAKGVFPGVENRAQAAELTQQSPGQIDRGLAPNAGAQEDGQQFGIGQG